MVGKYTPTPRGGVDPLCFGALLEVLQEIYGSKPQIRIFCGSRFDGGKMFG